MSHEFDLMGGWRKLHNDEMRKLYSSPSMIRLSSGKNDVGGILTRMGEKSNACSLLVESQRERDH
jgi:hypothetical protein